MKNFQLFLTLLLCLFSAGLFAQDTLMYRNGSTQIVKIMEVGLDDVKYRDYKNPEAPLFTVEKSEIKRIGFADGNTLRFEIDPLDLKPDPVAIKKTHCIKFEFLAPLADNITFGFEHLVKKGISMEYKIGVIGAGFSRGEENPSGMLVKAGIKFVNSPDYYVRGQKRTHPLRGGFIKPEIIFNRYTVRQTTYQFLFSPQTFNTTYEVTNYAINIVFGKQRILSEVATLDYYVGVGYGGQQSKITSGSSFPNSEEKIFHGAYSHSIGSKSSPIVISGGLTLGFLF